MKTKILSILALLLTVTQGAWAQTLPTDGTGAYLISSVDNWNTFCEDVNGGITYSGKTVKLTQNVGPVTTMAGGNTSFSGTFDGQGYTLTVSINVQNDNTGTLAAPFPAISGATIKKLHVAGNISVNRARPASIASFVNGDSEITNCKSSVSITASRGDWVDAGGFVARVNSDKALTMTGCTFAGSITYSDANGYEGGGMVGWTQANASANLTNCLFAPTSVSFANSKSKADNNFRMLVGGVGSSTLTRCYYNDVAANNTKIITDGEGKQARSISAGTDVTSLGISGASTEYNVSGITAYATGIKYNDVYYAGNGDEVSLALSHADAAEGYSFNEYTATAGTLSGTTLTMPDADVTINATWTENTATLTDGDDVATALSAWAGKTCTVTYTRSFTAGKASTVCLPFAYTKKTGDGSFYEFTGIKKVDSEYIATMTEPGTSTLTANTPYLYKAATTGNANVSGTYAIPASIEAGETTSGDWKFKGTYSTIKWTTEPTGIYGFSATDANDDITQGQFVKVGSYVRIKPMRCYLVYKDRGENYAGAPGMNRAASAGELLPETIGVRLISANGEVTAIGTLYTRTGEVSFDSEAWYTLDGKRLNAKPNTKGIYVNNGKKVVIK